MGLSHPHRSGVRAIARHRTRQPDLTRTPGHLLRRGHQRSQEIFAEHLGPHELTQQQLALLIAVSARPGSSLQALVEPTGTDRNTLAEIAPRLVRRGLLHRRRDARDGRAYQFALTPRGTALLQRLDPVLALIQRRILAPLQPLERATFIRCLRKIAGLPTAPVRGSSRR